MIPAPPLPPRLNLDRHGMPRDYATYCWMIYGKRVADKSPARITFLNRTTNRPNVGRKVMK